MFSHYAQFGLRSTLYRVSERVKVARHLFLDLTVSKLSWTSDDFGDEAALLYQIINRLEREEVGHHHAQSLATHHGQTAK